MADPASDARLRGGTLESVIVSFRTRLARDEARAVVAEALSSVDGADGWWRLVRRPSEHLLPDSDFALLSLRLTLPLQPGAMPIGSFAAHAAGCDDHLHE